MEWEDVCECDSMLNQVLWIRIHKSKCSNIDGKDYDMPNCDGVYLSVKHLPLWSDTMRTWWQLLTDWSGEELVNDKRVYYRLPKWVRSVTNVAKIRVSALHHVVGPKLCTSYFSYSSNADNLVSIQSANTICNQVFISIPSITSTRLCLVDCDSSLHAGSLLQDTIKASNRLIWPKL